MWRPAALIVGCLVMFVAVEHAFAKEAPLPDGWVVYPTPKPGACAWTRANYSRRQWRVRLAHGRLVIEPEAAPLPSLDETYPVFDLPFVRDVDSEGPPCSECVVRVDDGWLVGFDAGEFGGRLWWSDVSGRRGYPVPYVGRCRDVVDGGPPTASEQRQWMARNVHSLQRGSFGRVFEVMGLAHSDSSDGALNRIERHDGRWRSCLVRNLGAAASATVAEHPDQWLILTTRELLRVRSDGATKRLGRFAFLDKNVFPNSMVKLDDGVLYVGMLHFVARLLPQQNGTYRDQLLVPKNLPLFDHDEMIDDPNLHPSAYAECKRGESN